MIARMWRGWAPRATADDYQRHYESEVSSHLGSVAGFRGACLLRHDNGHEVMFTSIVLFTSLDAVRAFAGEDCERAVVEPAARRALSRWDERVSHHDVAIDLGTTDPDPEMTVVLAAYAAFARGDIDRAVAALDPQVEWIEPDEFPHGGRRVGPAAVADYLRRSRSTWAELVSEPAAHRSGDDIVVIHHLHGRLTDGTARDVTVADVFTFSNGLIVRMRAYADPAEVPGAGR
jgi:ketosteroid isomerase-like protein